MLPEFSVIVPTFNRAAKLARAIDSVVCQTRGDWELLVMDDGSVDNTEQVVASFGDSRIVYSWEENWGGPARPRNRGIAVARGTWLCFLDADDWWVPEKLEVCGRTLGGEVDFLYHGLALVGSGNGFFRRKAVRSRALNAPFLKDLLFNGNPIPNSSVIVRAAVMRQIGPIVEDKLMVAAEDYSTWLRIMDYTENVAYLPTLLGFYESHDQSISRVDMSGRVARAVDPYLGRLTRAERRKVEALIELCSVTPSLLDGGRWEVMKILFGCLIAGGRDVQWAALRLMLNVIRP